VAARQRRLQTNVALALGQQPEATAREAAEVAAALPGVPLPWKVPAVKQFGKRMDYEHPADLTEHYCFGGSDSRAAAVGGTAFRGGAVCMVQS
jgi:hypothetical protein